MKFSSSFICLIVYCLQLLVEYKFLEGRDLYGLPLPTIGIETSLGNRLKQWKLAQVKRAQGDHQAERKQDPQATHPEIVIGPN